MMSWVSWMKRAFRKPRVSVLSLTGCGGCQLEILFDKEFLKLAEVVEFSSFPFIKEEKEKESKHADIAFVEGYVASEEDVKVLKEIKENADMIVALGTCAVFGRIPHARIDAKHVNAGGGLHASRPHIKRVGPYPISKYVEVSFEIRGCPIISKEVKDVLKNIILNNRLKLIDKSVCFECTLHENSCFLDKGQACAGPITTGGCDAVCINNGLACVGCRGAYEDANFEGFVETLMMKGFSRKEALKILKEFVGYVPKV